MIMATVPYQFANTPNGSTIPLAQLDANFQYVENQITSGAGVTTFSGGTTGLLPATATSGAITLTGVLAVANGGTGSTTASGALTNLLPSQTGQNGKFLTTDGNGNLSWATSGSSGVTGVANGGTGLTATPTNGQLLIGNGTGYTLSTLTAGTGITIANTAGGITINATGGAGGGTVTSVGLSGGTTGLTVSGTPITASGTFTLNGFINISSGGTGATSAAAALTNLLPTQSGATAGQVLTSNGTSATWQTGTSAAGGANTQVQFNNSGSFGGDPNMTYTTGTQTLSVPNANVSNLNLMSGSTVGATLTYTSSLPTSTGPGINASLPAIADTFQITGGNLIVVNPNVGQTSYFINTDIVNPNYRGLIGGFLTDTTQSNACFAFYNNPSITTTYLDFYSNQGAMGSGTVGWYYVNNPTGLTMVTAGGNIFTVATGGPSTGVFCTGPFTQASDASLKGDIQTIIGSLDKIKNLNGVSFTWNSDETKRKSLGFIAQDVQKVIPEIVKEVPSEGKLGLEYTSIIPVLVNAIKELEARVAALEAK
jgi:hypothetical protein